MNSGRTCLFDRVSGHLAALAVAAGLLAAGAGGLSATTPVQVPDAVRVAIEDYVNSVIGERGQATIGALTLSVDEEQDRPTLLLEEVEVAGLLPGRMVSVGEIEIVVEIRSLFSADIGPSKIAARGLTIGPPSVPAAPSSSTQGQLTDALASLPMVLESMTSSGPDQVSVVDARFVDALPGIDLVAGSLELVRAEDDVRILGSMAMVRDGMELGSATIDGRHHAADGSTDMAVTAKSADAGILASILSAASGRTSGGGEAGLSARLKVDRTGRLISMTGSISLEGGAILLPGIAEPYLVGSASAGFAYGQETGRITISDIVLETETGRGRGRGFAYVDAGADAGPAVTGQLDLAEILIDDPGLFAEPAEIESISVAFRVGLAPLHLHFTRFSLDSGDAVLRAEGEAGMADNGWFASLSFSVDDMDRNTLLAHWPVSLAAGVRGGVARVHEQGSVDNIHGALSYSGQSGWTAHVSFEFADSIIRYMRDFPPVLAATGFGTLTEKSAYFVLERGSIAMSGSGDVDVSGSDFSVPDMWAARPGSVVRVKFRGPVQAVFSWLDHPPFGFLEKAGLGTDFAEGLANGYSTVQVPVKAPRPEEVTFSVGGTITDVRSTALGEDVPLESVRLAVWANNSEIMVSGAGTIDGAPGAGEWRLGLDEDGGSLLIGTIELSQDLLESLGITRVGRLIDGTREADFFVSFSPGAEIRFGITTSAAALGMNIPLLALAADGGEATEFVVEGVLDEETRITRVSIIGDGFEAEGVPRVAPSGQGTVLEFESVRIGDWFSAPVRLGTDESGKVRVALLGGVIDLTRFGKVNVAGGSGGLDLPMAIRLDRLILSPTIELTEIVGEVSVDGPVRGKLTGRINGGQIVGIEIATSERGLAAYLVTNDAGAAMRDAGITGNLHGGEMELSLLPRTGAGSYRGQLLITNAVVRDMPILSEVLSYISIVGLFDDLMTSGITFSTIEAEFEIDSERIVLNNGVAGGPSIGIRMEGFLDTRHSVLDIEGTITPFNPMNEVARRTFLQFFGLKKGAGIGGVTFFVKGPTDNLTAGANPLTIITPGPLQEIFN